MAVDTRITARAVGVALAERARAYSVARRLWVSSDRETVHLWLEVGPIEHAEELELYGLVDGFYARLPGIDPFLHVMNPQDHTVEIQDAVPSDADEITLRPGVSVNPLTAQHLALAARTVMVALGLPPAATS